MLLAVVVGLMVSQGTTMGSVRALVPPDLRLPDMPSEAENGWSLAVAASGGRFGTKTLSGVMKDLGPLVAKDLAAKEKGERPASPARADASTLLSKWPKEPTPADIAQAEEALQAYAARFRFLEAAVARPVWAMPRYEDRYRPETDEFRDDFPGLSGFRTLARALRLRVHVRLAQNRSDDAVADAILVRRLSVRLSSGYGGVMTNIIGEGIAATATAAALQIAHHASAGEAQVAKLKRTWEENPQASDLANALRHDFDFETLRGIASSPTTLPIGPGVPKVSPEMTRELKRLPLLDRPATVAYGAKYLRIAIENRARPWSQQIKIEPAREAVPPMPPGFEEPEEGKPLTKAQEALFLKHLRKNPNPVGRYLIDTVASTYATFEGAQRRREAVNLMAITAFSLRIAQLREGKLPASLDALVTAGLLPAVPSDPFRKGPLRYDPTRRVLWAVGTDGKDDGGKGRSFSSDPDVVLALP